MEELSLWILKMLKIITCLRESDFEPSAKLLVACMFFSQLNKKNDDRIVIIS